MLLTWLLLCIQLCFECADSSGSTSTSSSLSVDAPSNSLSTVPWGITDITSSVTVPIMNASTSRPITIAANGTGQNKNPSTWSLWTANYPANCDNYFQSVWASPSLSSAWNASENAAYFSSAYDCLSSLASYASASESYEQSNVYVWWSTITRTEAADFVTATFTSTHYKLTTLCDGIPRAITGADASTYKTTYTRTDEYMSAAVVTYDTTYSTSTKPFTTPPPSCTLGCKACSMLMEAAEWSQSIYDTKSEIFTNVLFPWDCPFLPTPGDTNPLLPDDCQVDVWSAQLFYWPVTTINGNVCGKNGTTITPTPTGDGPNTYNLNGTILTSPTVYVSFYNLSYETAYFNSTSTYVGNTLMAFNASDIQSQRGYHGVDGYFSFNYADLPPNPVPSSAWFGQADCWFNKNYCIPIAMTSYAPALVFPSVFLHMTNFNPAWTAKQCVLGVEDDGIWDPPVACQPVSSLSGPALAPIASTTTVWTSQATPATPSSTPDHPPTQTMARTHTQTSSRQETSGVSFSHSLLVPSISVGHAPSSESSHLNVGGIIASALGMSRTSSDPPNMSFLNSILDQLSSSSTYSASTNGDPASSLAISAAPARGSDPIATFYHSTMEAYRESGTWAVINGTTFIAGQIVTIGSHILSIDPSGNILDGTATITLEAVNDEASATRASESSVYRTPNLSGVSTNNRSMTGSITSSSGSLSTANNLGITSMQSVKSSLIIQSSSTSDAVSSSFLQEYLAIWIFGWTAGAMALAIFL
ncbi:hypothetical protein M433DRAFT_130278 [Acidomyces richmondensis BFW]|nr:MAG: hypothetical protein FE78DRAFT_71199 [Acidomyces sp. 'richmondensis']KYG50632.1 hypothetical protein M433DRAFT_130278 [Acidomyces richmondensis BFW]